jgi:hypothetical protein
MHDLKDLLMWTMTYALQGSLLVQMMREDFTLDPHITGTPGNSSLLLHRLRHNQERGGGTLDYKGGV